ncbi:MAG: hypothetical protein HYZ66_06325, partial [Chlamydiae bacterium]|nr:hypothetical protein [Chlamydiota bacterium]
MKKNPKKKSPKRKPPSKSHHSLPPLTHGVEQSEGSYIAGVIAKGNGSHTKKEITLTIDTTSPQVTITSPENNSITNQSQITITGSVNEELSNLTINLNGLEVRSWKLEGLSFEETITLELGENTI